LDDNSEKILTKYENKDLLNIIPISSRNNLNAITNTITSKSSRNFKLELSKDKEKDEVVKVLLSELKENYDELTIDYSQMFEFYKKITSRIDSCKFKIKELNIKVIHF